MGPPGCTFLKKALLLKLEASQKCPLHETETVCYLCSALGVRVCQELSLDCYSPMRPRNVSLPGLKSQAIKKHPLACSYKNQVTRYKKQQGHQMCVEAPLQEMLVLQNAVQREYEDGATG